MQDLRIIRVRKLLSSSRCHLLGAVCAPICNSDLIFTLCKLFVFAFSESEKLLLMDPFYRYPSNLSGLLKSVVHLRVRHKTVGM